ncbi:CAP domain-containing protein [Pantanalinema rosaneae CENA516]|uniref:CAP domain-containing protein n=1 Tax=Pantanalinema rosaneae TaxID=1620701 RepID=UPI003D6EC3DD
MTHSQPRSYKVAAIVAALLTMPTMIGLLPIFSPGQVSPALAMTQMAQQPTPPFPLDGKPVYVRQGNQWQEALLVGYAWNSRSGYVYTVQYVSNNQQERTVPVDRILSLAEAQNRGIARATYDLSSQAGVQQMLNAHNEWRQRVGVPALTWSPQLASYAQEWAEKLLRENRFEHRQNSSYGENLASAWGQQLSPDRVVRMWGEEVNDYDYATNSCQPGKMCGHYTQIVWRTTQQVGCGMARGNGKEIWVCNYNPPGNFVGRKPY